MTERRKTLIEHPAGDPCLEQYRAELHRFLIRCLRGQEDIEDLLQDVYARFLQSPQKELVRQPRPYLYRITANVVAELGLRRKRRPIIYDSRTAAERLESDSTLSPWHDPSDEELHHRQEMTRILLQLPTTYREVLLMRIRDGLSRKEIAWALRRKRPSATCRTLSPTVVRHGGSDEAAGMYMSTHNPAEMKIAAEAAEAVSSRGRCNVGRQRGIRRVAQALARAHG